MNYSIGKDSPNHLCKVACNPILYYLIMRIKLQMNLQQSDQVFFNLGKCITQPCNHKQKEKVVGPLLMKCLIYE